uniref:Carbonic anhydrase n=1 Tax=Lobosphaera incisa TaxID=312850 RepID=A0A0D5CPL9_9CHLO|nr:beta type carbonic anhydrase [Lobosphaera incisa]
MAPITKDQADISNLLQNNRKWATDVLKTDPNFFDGLKDTQTPEYLWIGCSDSRVPANQVLGLHPGDVFVQRNVGNLATHKDMNVMACLEYSVNHLKVKHVIVCGHYGCGAVKASLTFPCHDTSLVNLWIADIRDTRNAQEAALRELPEKEQWNKLCELNVVRQVFNVCTSPVVQAAWERGQGLAIHGLIYELHTGHLQEVVPPITGISELDAAVDASKPSMKPVNSQLSNDLKKHTNFQEYMNRA